MNSQLIDFDRILLILLAFLLLRVCWQLYAPRLRRRWRKAKARLARRRKPRSPKDCPHCCQGLSLESAPVQRSVELYAELNDTNPAWKKIYADWATFRRDQNLWFRFTENRFDDFMQAQKL